MNHVHRRLRVVLITFATAGLVLWLAWRFVVSPYLAARVAPRLEAAYGLPVRIAHVDIGLGGTSLRGVRLFDVGADPSEPPWAVIEEVHADVSLFDLLRGRAMPQQLTLSGAAVTLRLGADGRLLTRLPSGAGKTANVPNVHLKRGRLTLQQEGRPQDLVVRCIDLTLRSDGGELILAGFATDPTWGEWTLSGQVNPDNGASLATLKTEQVHLTQALLETLPFVPPAVWQQVQLEGDTPVRLDFRFSPESGAFHHRVELAPAATQVRVAAIDLHAVNARGRVIVEDGLVQLREVEGEAADGKLATNADLDFRTTPRRLQFDVTASGLDVRRLPASWGVPAKLGGRLSGQTDLLVSLSDGQARTTGYGEGRIMQVPVAGQEATILLKLSENTSETSSGMASGGKQASCFLEASLQMTEVDVERLVRELDLQVPCAVAGRLAFQLRLVMPFDRLHDTASYRLHGTAQFPRLTVAGLDLREARATVACADGLLTVTDFQSEWQGAPLTGSAKVWWADAHRYQAKLILHPVDLTALQRLPSELRPDVKITGRFQADADLQGTLHPFRVQAAGTGTASDLTVDDFQIGSLTFRWSGNEDRLALRDVRASLYDGEVAGTAVVPLRASEAGNVDLRFEKLDVGALAKGVPGIPFRLEGRASGTIQGTLPAVQSGQEREFAAAVELQAPRLRVREIPTERLHGTVNYRKRSVDYRLQGDTLGGRFHLEGEVPVKPPAHAEPRSSGRLHLEGVQLSRLWEALGLQENLGPLQGSVELQFKYRQEGAESVPVGDGRAVLSRLRWNGTELADTVQGEVRLTADALRLQNLSGSVGEGLLRGQVVVHLKQFERSWFNLALDRVEASRLLAPWPAWAAHLQGPLEVRLRGRLGAEWNGTGQVVLTRGKVFGVDVAEWRLPVDFTFAPNRGYGHLEVRESSAQAALGRVVGQASWRWGSGTRLEGQVRFHEIDLHTVLRQAADTGRFSGGRVSGRLDFRGSDVHALDDVTATLEASLQQTQALDLPVLRQLAPFVVPGQATQTTFAAGELRATLSRGIFRIQRLTLSGALVQLFIQGTVTLQGRLGLDVTAASGLGANTLRALGLRMPATGPIPTALLTEAGRLLSPRLLRLHVTGTVRNPTVQVDPLLGLTEEVLRFLVSGIR